MYSHTENMVCSNPCTCTLPPYLPPSLPQYQLREDYASTGEHAFSLGKGDIVEVLDNNIDGKWFVRTVGGKVDHGWVPSAILERIMGEEEPDGKSQKWVQVAAGERGEAALYSVTVYDIHCPLE